MTLIAKLNWIYLIRAGDTQYFKIGVSQEPRARLARLQTGCPLELKMLFVIEEPQPMTFEAFWHQHYSKYHVRGEWFEFRDEAKVLKAFERMLGGPRFVYKTHDMGTVISRTELHDHRTVRVTGHRILGYGISEETMIRER